LSFKGETFENERQLRTVAHLDVVEDDMAFLWPFRWWIFRETRSGLMLQSNIVQQL
jgi:hypothetical protein